MTVFKNPALRERKYFKALCHFSPQWVLPYLIRLFLRLLCAGSQPCECEQCVAVSGYSYPPLLCSSLRHCQAGLATLSTLPSLICLRRSQLTLDWLRQRSLESFHTSSQCQSTFFPPKLWWKLGGSSVIMEDAIKAALLDLLKSRDPSSSEKYVIICDLTWFLW